MQWSRFQVSNSFFLGSYVETRGSSGVLLRRLFFLFILVLPFFRCATAIFSLLLGASCLFVASHRGGQVALLLPLHSSVLEPDFYLALRQTERVGDFDAPASGQVAVEMKLLLELERLITGIYLTSSASVRPVAHSCSDTKWRC